MKKFIVIFLVLTLFLCCGIFVFNGNRDQNAIQVEEQSETQSQIKTVPGLWSCRSHSAPIWGWMPAAVYTMSITGSIWNWAM